MSLLAILGIGTVAFVIDSVIKEFIPSSNNTDETNNIVADKAAGIISIQTIKNIVDQVSIKNGTRKLELPDYKNYDYKSFSKNKDSLINISGGNETEEEKEVKYSDNARELKGIATKVVVDSYVTTKENLFRFMKLVVGTFEEALSLYAKQKKINKDDLIFVYKGGNVMRLLSNEFLIELPGTASRKINEFYKNYFRRSDADFAIYINPNLDEYETIFAELTYISYLLQVVIRNHFIQFPMYFFEYDKFNDEAKRDVLVNFLDDLNAADALDNVNNEDYYGAKFVSVNHRGTTVCHLVNGKIGIDSECPGVYGGEEGKQDSFTSFTDVENKKDRETVVFNMRDEQNYIYVSHNTALEFSDAANFQRKFNLARTKIDFNATYVTATGSEITRSYGGELIDVSLAHRESSGVTHFWKNTSNYLRKYTLTFNDESITFNAYSISYIVEDLEDVIYKQSERPWLDKKYQKRVNRSFYFYFLDLFEKVPSNKERLEILADLNEILSRISNGRDSKEILVDLKDIHKMVKDKKLLIDELVTQVIRLFKLKEADSSEKEEFNKYNELLMTNIKVIMDGFKRTEQFCSIRGKGKFNEETLYNTSVDSLAGGKKN